MEKKNNKAFFNSLANLDFLIFGGIVIIIFAFWKLDYNFFWRSEWDYLAGIKNEGISYLFSVHSGYYKPIHKLIYLLELKVFGVNTTFFNYVNLGVFAITIYFLHKIANLIFQDTIFACLLSLICCIHPLNSNHLLWNFQIGLGLQLLFQVLTIYFFLKFVDQRKAKYFIFSVLVLIGQNYSYQNGVFLPLLLMGGIFLFNIKENKNWYLILLLIIQLTFVGIQLNIEELSNGGLVKGNILTNIPGFFKAMGILFSTNLSRALILVTSIKGIYLGWVILGILFLIFLSFYKLSKTNRKPLSFILTWFAIVNISIGLTLWQSILNNQGISYVFLSTSLIPIFLCLSIVFFDYYKKLIASYPKLLLGLVPGILIVAFVFCQKFTHTYSLRAIRNQLSMGKAINGNQVYAPFDDPDFEVNSKKKSLKNAKANYLYWKGKTNQIMFNEKLFNPSSVIDNKSYRPK